MEGTLQDGALVGVIGEDKVSVNSGQLPGGAEREPEKSEGEH